MSTWTTDLVRQWLVAIGVELDIAEQFQQEQVDGQVLLEITEEDLKKEFPSLRFGNRKKVIIERNRIKARDAETMQAQGSGRSASRRRSKEQTSSPKELLEESDELGTADSNEAGVYGSRGLNCSEICRTFDRDVTLTDKYTHHDILSCSEGQPQDLLQPIHRFVQTDLSTGEGKFVLACDTVRFVCACLNDRTNGTLHFGVASNTSDNAKTGEVLGTTLNDEKQIYEDYVRKAITRCFVPEQCDIAQACVRPLKFIEVIPAHDTPKFVVEIDVVPSYSLCEDDAFFVRIPKRKTRKSDRSLLETQALYRWRENNPTEIHGDEVVHFMTFKRKLAETRKEREQWYLRRFDSIDYSTLKDKLVNLLCLGEDRFIGDVYPILVINKPADHMDQSFMKENMNFLHNIEWKAVFDFDAKSVVCDFITNEDHLIKISTTADDFYSRSSENINDPERLRSLEEDLRNSIPNPWIFANGHCSTGADALEPYAWKKQKREGFKKAVDFFASEIPAGRAIIVFVLLSKDWKVMLEAAEEFFSAFPDQWMCIAKEENVSQPWNEELLRRHCIDKDSLKNRMVVGMPWEHVQEAILQIRGPRKNGECMLPTSTGTDVTMKQSKLNELSDLEVLSAVQCENAEILETDKIDDYRKKVEAAFYKGGEVDWWNFYFPDHVCERKNGIKAKEFVRRILEQRHEHAAGIGKVTMYHQPGAGGTTTCKHILWDFRRTHRCAIVRNISEQTHDQIITLWSFKDERAKPVLVLLDNEDEEKSKVLMAMLEESTKQMTRDEAGRLPSPICVFLVCSRHSKLPGNIAPLGTMAVSLKHELDTKETLWFKKKYQELETNHQQDSGVDPKLLISFNILKENFGKEYIERTVKMLIAAITEKETLLLKYVALVNTFDLGFNSLPTCAFDPLMVDLPFAPGPRRGPHAVSYRWETNLSQGIRILTNEVYNQRTGYTHSIRITSPLLSNVILAQLRKRSNACEEPLSEVVADFFNNDIFNQKSHARVTLLKAVKEMLVNRIRLPSGRPDGKFSPLVGKVIKLERKEKATLMLQHGYKLTEDAFVAQQVARLCIDEKVWTNAETYAQYATQKKPDNSCLWDTYGRIFLSQVVEKYNGFITSEAQLSVEEITPVIDTAIRGIDIFRKEQHASESQRHMSSNNAGYIGEVEITVALLDCLNFVQVFSDRDVLHRFLVYEEYVPEDVRSLFDVNGQDYVSWLKQLQWDVRKVLVRLDDENEQLHEDRSEHRRNVSVTTILRKKVDLHSYFGEATDAVEVNLTDKEKCQYRRRLLFHRDTDTIGGIFRLLDERNAERSLCKIKELLVENIRDSTTPDANDLRAMISVNLALLHIRDKYLNVIRYDDMVAWSRGLYELRHTVPFISLEPYLFYTLFNWPRKNTRSHLMPKELNEAVRQWKETYYKKYPRQREEDKPYRRRDNTKFFLANGSDMASITSFDQLGRRKTKGDVFWKLPEVLRKLQRFSGRLSRDGGDVLVNLQCECHDDIVISIPTSRPIGNRTMRNQTVFFVIGFSWFGPKAFDVSSNDPTEDVQYMVEDHQNPRPSPCVRPKQDMLKTDYVTHQRFVKKLNEIVVKLRQVEEVYQERRTLKKKEVKQLLFSRRPYLSSVYLTYCVYAQTPVSLF